MSEVEKKIDADGGIYYYKKGTKILHREDGPAVVFAGGNQYWYKNGELHREDGPAAEYKDGDRAWYINGKLHREGAPAVVYANGDTKGWYINGELHREDGPAFEYADGDDEWYLNGEEVTEEEVMSDVKDYQVGGSHYAIQYIQPWDYMEACMSEEEFKGYLRGNVIKYVSRYDKKGGLQDIDKAMHYLEKLRSLL